MELKNLKISLTEKKRSGFLNLIEMPLNFFLEYSVGSCVGLRREGEPWGKTEKWGAELKSGVTCVAGPGSAAHLS